MALHDVKIPINPVEWLVYAAACEVWRCVGGYDLCEDFYASRAILQYVERGRSSVDFPNWKPKS